jgi:AraC-like DNA-binding protein
MRPATQASDAHVQTAVDAVSAIVPTRVSTTARRRCGQPTLENEVERTLFLGFEPARSCGIVRCLEHGFPTLLNRWHYHPEYELHFIAETRGRAFVGDYIGHYEPGHLVLTGPGLPHNWLAADAPDDGPSRAIHKVLQFRDEPLREAAKCLTDLAVVLELLERSRHGIEFFGFEQHAPRHFERVRSAHGLPRLVAFLEYLSELAAWTDYRLLSSSPLKGHDDKVSAQTANIIEYITEHAEEPLSMADVAKRFSMTEKYFSKYFRRATGNTFTDFVSQLRIDRACQLLLESDQYVVNICYEVGFNNVANFNRRFARLKGMSPSQFRQQAVDRLGLEFRE